MMRDKTILWLMATSFLIPSVLLAQSNVTVQNTTYPSGTTQVSASNSISASPNVTVPSGANVIYSAGTGISLGSGFQVAAGGIFAANVGSSFVDPTIPGNFAAGTIGSTFTTLNWTTSTSPTGVTITGYQIYRNGTLIATTSGTATTYTDSTLNPSSGYTYYVQALDANGNRSTPTSSVFVGTQPDLEVFTPVP
jgi:Fibronectin type III domain